MVRKLVLLDLGNKANSKGSRRPLDTVIRRLDQDETLRKEHEENVPASITRLPFLMLRYEVMKAMSAR